MGFKVASRVRGLSDEAFREAFGTEEQYRTALVRLRWPDGFVCPCCGHREHCVLAGRGLYQCNRCKKQTSPTAGKTPFVAAVSTSPEGRPRKLKLAPVKGFRKREIARGAKHWLAPGAAVVTDGLGCWSALDEAACSHQAIRTGSGRQAARMASFKWVNTTLGNIKSAITGTYRKLGPDHAGRYLASFAWRYNRRYQLHTMIPRFVHSAAQTQPMPYRLLIAG